MLSWRLGRRLLLSCLAVVLVAGGFVLAGAHDGMLPPSAAQNPTSTTPKPSGDDAAPAPDAVVPPKVRTQSTVVPAVAKVPAKQGKRTVVAKLDRKSTKNFGTVGVTWSAATKETDVAVRLRTRSDGRWSAWQQLELDDLSAGGRPGTEPIWVGHADGVAVEVKTASGKAPADIKVLTIDAGKSPTDATIGSSAASATSQVSSAVYHPTAAVAGTVQETATRSLPPQPKIILRAAWGARPPTSCDSPRTASATKGAVIHHTAGSNNYTQAESAAIVRGDQAYHMDGHGWCDIGYNFIVDKYGQIFEGREGGITKQVRAAHSGNAEVNLYAMGVAMAGTFSTVEPSDALKDAVVRLVAWRFGQMGLKAKGTWRVSETLVGTHDGLDAHHLNLIAGHRNVVGTECPGAKAYAWLSAKGGLRDRVATALATSIPAAATGLKAAPTASGATLTWDAVSGATSYGVCLTTSEASTTCKNFSNLTKPTLTLSGLVPTSGTDYYFTVHAHNAVGYSTSAKKGFDLASSSSSSTTAAADTVTVPSSGSIALTGHGFGHGIGMNQYGAQNAAIQGKSWGDIIRYYYPGITGSSLKGSIRVLISADTTVSVVVKPRSGLAFRNVSTKKLITLPTSVIRGPVLQWRISPLSGSSTKSVLQYRIASGWRTYLATEWTGDGQFEASGPITLILPSGSATYRGALRSAVPAKGSTTRDTVNVATVEDYLRGVVPAEMPSSWKSSALKAQAVAARTYAARSLTPSRYYDICDTTSCQVYRGTSAETATTNAAIADTTGRIVTYQGSPALTQFSSSSGGYSAAGSQPYLKQKVDVYDNFSGNPNHSWKTTIKASTLEKAYPKLGTLKSLTVTKRSGAGAWGGRVTTLSLVGSKSSVSISGTTARSVLGLKSTWFAF